MKRYTLILFLILSISIFAVPQVSEAVSWWPIVPCGLNQPTNGETPLDPSYYEPCSRCDMFRFVDNMIKLLLTVVVPAGATIMFIWAGVKILTGQGSPESFKSARAMLWTTIQGVAIIFGAWLITNAILQTLARTTLDVNGNPVSVAGNWWQITCVEDTAGGGPGPTGPGPTSGTPGPTTTVPTPTVTTPPVPQGTCTGVQCSDSNINVCADAPSANCSESGVNAWDTQIRAAAQNNQIGSGINTVAMVKAVMSQESGGRTNLTSYDGTSHGIMQMQVETASSFKSGCTTDTITTAWLKDSNNVQASICISINYMRSLIGQCGADIKDIAAGYNGGGAGKGACGLSTSCASCSICGNEPTRRWECPWDGPDGEHKVCNVDRRNSPGQLDNFNQTRVYAPKVSYCYNKYK